MRARISARTFISVHFAQCPECNKPNVAGRLARNAILIQRAFEWGIKRTETREKKATSSLHNKRAVPIRSFHSGVLRRSYLCRLVPRQPARPLAMEISFLPWLFSRAIAFLVPALFSRLFFPSYLGFIPLLSSCSATVGRGKVRERAR